MRRARLLAKIFGFGGVGVLVGGANCNPESDFQCVSDENCIAEGEGGVCEANSFCTFPDAECDSGRRWHDRASSLAGMCFGDNVGTGTDTTSGSMSTSTSTTTGTTTSTTSSGDSTTGGGETSMTTAGPESTGAAESSSSGDGKRPVSCDEMYGAAVDYLLCEEAAETCRFNTTTDMAADCSAVCQSFGGTCVSAQLNEGDLCASSGETTCDDGGNFNLICTCSR